MVREVSWVSSLDFHEPHDQGSGMPVSSKKTKDISGWQLEAGTTVFCKSLASSPVYRGQGNQQHMFQVMRLKEDDRWPGDDGIKRLARVLDVERLVSLNWLKNIDSVELPISDHRIRHSQGRQAGVYHSRWRNWVRSYLGLPADWSVAKWDWLSGPKVELRKNCPWAAEQSKRNLCPRYYYPFEKKADFQPNSTSLIASWWLTSQLKKEGGSHSGQSLTRLEAGSKLLFIFGPSSLSP